MTAAEAHDLLLAHAGASLLDATGPEEAFEPDDFYLAKVRGSDPALT